SATQSLPILVVTESAGALESGSIINFVPVDDRIRFEISVTQAERSGLKISSRLLGVAQKIESGKP
ncbi:MAG TPA: YfiR family protein, partial [Burkholderiaceae bacterium]|nr:YfiR family protein [Burkholderiaceae bacterium]